MRQNPPENYETKPTGKFWNKTHRKSSSRTPQEIYITNPMSNLLNCPDFWWCLREITGNLPRRLHRKFISVNPPGKKEHHTVECSVNKSTCMHIKHIISIISSIMMISHQIFFQIAYFFLWWHHRDLTRPYIYTPGAGIRTQTSCTY